MSRKTRTPIPTDAISTTMASKQLLSRIILALNIIQSAAGFGICHGEYLQCQTSSKSTCLSNGCKWAAGFGSLVAISWIIALIAFFALYCIWRSAEERVAEQDRERRTPLLDLDEPQDVPPGGNMQSHGGRDFGLTGMTSRVKAALGVL